MSFGCIFLILMLWAVTFKLSFPRPIEQRNRLPCYLGPVWTGFGFSGAVGPGWGLPCGPWTSWYVWVRSWSRPYMLYCWCCWQYPLSRCSQSALFDEPMVDKVSSKAGRRPEEPSELQTRLCSPGSRSSHSITWDNTTPPRADAAATA